MDISLAETLAEHKALTHRKVKLANTQHYIKKKMIYTCQMRTLITIGRTNLVKMIT